MKRTRNNKVLGLAVGDRSILVAEVAAAPAGGGGGAGGRPRVTKVGEFAFPAGVTLQQGAADLGRGLGEFLRAGGFAARAAVFGVPARWVLNRPKEVPPADPSVIADSLRLQAEGDFPAEIQAVHDYAGETSPSEGRTVLLLAMPGRYVDQLKAVAEAARLHVETITPVAVAVAAATARAAGPVGLAGRGRDANKDALALSVGPGGAEFVASRGGHARALRHLGSAASPPAALVGELRRAVASVPGSANGTLTPVVPVAPAADTGDDDESHGPTTPLNGNGRRGLTVWGGGAVTDAAGRKALADALGLSVDAGGLKGLGVTADGVPQAEAYAPAVAVALTGLADEPPPVDFLHSRLAPPKKQRIGRPLVLAAVAAVLVVAVGVYALVSLNRKQAALDEMNAKLTRIQPDLKAAQAAVNRTAYAQAWQGGNPRFLACLRDLDTALRPDRGEGGDGDIYLTSLVLRENMKATILGKAADNKTVTELPNRMKATKRFADAKVTSLIAPKPTGPGTPGGGGGSGGRGSRGGGFGGGGGGGGGGGTNGTDRPEWSFSITFTYVPE